MKKNIALAESVASQLYHLFAFKFRGTKNCLGKAMIIISIDVDVGSKVLGIANMGKNDANVNRYFSEYTIGEIEEMALSLFLDLFESVNAPVTFAVRGQLADVDTVIFERLVSSPVKHDVGAHGYFHRKFQDLSCDEAENELSMVSSAMKKFNVFPKSFIFPVNSVAHLDLLEKYGYECYRGYGDFRSDNMCIEKCGQLYNIRPSLYLDHGANPLLLKKILDVAVAKKAPLHLWFHLWNFGQTKQSIQKTIDRILFPTLKYAKEKEACELLTFETMFSATKKIERGFNS